MCLYSIFIFYLWVEIHFLSRILTHLMWIHTYTPLISRNPLLLHHKSTPEVWFWCGKREFIPGTDVRNRRLTTYYTWNRFESTNNHTFSVIKVLMLIIFISGAGDTDLFLKLHRCLIFLFVKILCYAGGD